MTSIHFGENEDFRMHDLHRIQASRQTTAFGEAPEKRMSLSPHDFNLRNHCRSLRTEMAGVRSDLSRLETERSDLRQEWERITSERHDGATGDRPEAIKAEQGRLRGRINVSETLIRQANERLKALTNDWDISGCNRA